MSDKLSEFIEQGSTDFESMVNYRDSELNDMSAKVGLTSEQSLRFKVEIEYLNLMTKEL